jgi:hypothetical protein
VVTIGFPNTALQQWVHEQSLKPIISTEVLNVFEWGKTFIAEGYVKWKNAIVLKENKTTLHRMHIEEEVRSFPEKLKRLLNHKLLCARRTCVYLLSLLDTI